MLNQILIETYFILISDTMNEIDFKTPVRKKFKKDFEVPKSPSIIIPPSPAMKRLGYGTGICFIFVIWNIYTLSSCEILYLKIDFNFNLILRLILSYLSFLKIFELLKYQHLYSDYAIE